MNLANNPAYTVAFESKVHNLKLYAPAGATEYHMSRYMAASAQDIFSSAGATKELTGKMYAEVKKICNEAHQKKDVSAFMDINTLMDNLLYRHAYPVDELCAIRMGAIFCFMEDEDPGNCQDFFTQRKVTLATGDHNRGIPADVDLYSFFLSMGVAQTPAYAQLQDTLNDTNYLRQRQEMLQGLIPRRLPTE